MAVDTITRLKRERASEDPNQGEIVEVYRVTFDDAGDAPEDVLELTSGVPLIDSPHWNLPRFICKNREARHVAPSTPPIVDLVVTYANTVNNKKRSEQHVDDPTQRSMLVTPELIEVDVPLLKDAITNKIIRNSAKELVAGLTTKLELLRYRCTLYVASVPSFDQFRNRVNQKPIRIWGHEWKKHQIRFCEVKFSEVKQERGEVHRRYDFSLLCDPRDEGHQLKILQSGLYERVNGALVRCRHGEVEVQQPVPLDNNGRMIPSAALDADPINAPKYQIVNRFNDIDFKTAKIPLPTTFL